MPNSKFNLLIAGGGTGGHIYPGIAIGKAAQERFPECEVHFVGAVGGLEEKIFPKEKQPFYLLKIGKLHKSVGIKTQIKTLLGLPLAFWQSFLLLRRIRPKAVLGVGGFASGPVLFVATLLGYRTALWEPNAYPGLTNRWLSSRVSICLLVFKEAREYLKAAKKVALVGLPVRDSIARIPIKTQTQERPLHVLVFGGSQGARAINQAVSQAICQGGEWLNKVEIVHQTGAADWQQMQKVYSQVLQQNKTIEVQPYLHNMDERYTWADLVICRSGASTVAEICSCRRPAIFVPLPTAADDHQRKNAEALVKVGAAILCLQPEFTPEKVKSMVTHFRDHRDELVKVEQNLEQFQFKNAAQKIVDEWIGA